MTRRVALALGLVLALAIGAQAAVVYIPLATTPAPTVQWATVTRVVDGDTVDVTLEGCPLEYVRVRLLAIDTPERGQCYYAEATAATRAMVDGARVGLERDVSEWDSFGRLLRHIYTEAGNAQRVGAWVNGELVARGCARVYIVGKDTRYAGALEALQADAQAHGRGGWDACGW